MLGQRLYTLSVYCFAAGVLALSYAWAGVDPVQFFTQDAPAITQTLSSTPGQEIYLAQDRFGNPLQVKIKEPLSMYAEIGGSLLAQGLELPTMPIYPTFLQLEPNGKRVRAIVQPQAASQVSMQSVERLTPTQMGEWLGQMVFNHILGNSNALTQADHVVMSGEHVVANGLGQAFRSYDLGRADNLTDYLNRIPSFKLKSLSESDAEHALMQLSLYLSRLEKLSSSDISNLFGRTFESAAAQRQANHLAPIDYAAELARRIQSEREEAIAYFKKVYPRLSGRHHLSNKIRVDQPVFRLPVFEKDSKKALLKKSPEDLLWETYFQNSPKTSVKGESKIAKLLEQAKRRESIYYVGPSVNIKYLDAQPDDPPQTHLSSKNAKTLVVVPANDEEAKEIARIAKLSGAEVMRLDGVQYPHGSRLTQELADQVIKRAKLSQVDTIAVVELPGDPFSIENFISQQGFKFVPIDHHSDAIAARAQPFSSLEQAAQLLGYDLGGRSKIIEVNDRSFVTGLKDLGLSKEEVMKRFPPRYSAHDIKKIPKFKSRFGDFYVLVDFKGFPALTGSLSIHDWPKVPNIINLGRSLKFSGDPKFRERLTQIFKEHDGDVRSHFYGGDATRSQFWALKGVPDDKVGLFNSKLKKLIEKALDPSEVMRFRQVVSEMNSNAPTQSGCMKDRLKDTLAHP